MKKIFVLIALIFAINQAFPQMPKVNSALGFLNDPSGVKIDKAKETIDEAIIWAKTQENLLNEQREGIKKMPDGKDKDKALKSNTKEMVKLAKAWYVNGQIYQAIHESPLPNFKSLDADALEKSYESYLKAMSLGSIAEKGYSDKLDILKRIQNLMIHFINKGVEFFNAKDFEKALGAFEKTIEINQMPDFNKVDTAIFYNAALSADNAKKYDKAVKYYKKVIELKYEGARIYIYAANACKAAGDTASAVQLYKDGIQAFPDNGELLVELTNYYLNTNPAEALKFLELAIQKDPSNYTFYFAQGTLYDKQGNQEKAMKCYEKSLSINDSTNLNANYNMGALYYNRAGKIMEGAIGIHPTKVKEYNAEVEKANTEYKKALPYLEKAHMIDPNELVVMQTLLTIYVRLSMKEKQDAMQVKINAAKGQ